MHHLSHHIISEPQINRSGRGFAFVAQFRVFMQLDHSTDWTKFEYRQYIKGDCQIYHGSFISAVLSPGTWRWDNRPSIDGERFFNMPGGLNNNEYREDAEIVDGVIQKYGYRSNPAVHRLGMTDHYLPSQAKGRIYQSMDTCGVLGNGLEVGMRIIYNLYYEGRIIDTSLPRTASQTILRRHWHIRADDIITPRS